MLGRLYVLLHLFKIICRLCIDISAIDAFVFVGLIKSKKTFKATTHGQAFWNKFLTFFTISYFFRLGEKEGVKVFGRLTLHLDYQSKIDKWFVKEGDNRIKNDKICTYTFQIEDLLVQIVDMFGRESDYYTD